MPLQPGRGKQHQLEWPWSAAQVEHLDDMLTTLFKRVNSLQVGGGGSDVVQGAANTVLISNGTDSAYGFITDANVTDVGWSKITRAPRDEPLTNGDPVTPELIFDGFGDVIMVEVF